MKKKIQLLIIPLLLIFTLACNLPLNMYEFFFNNDNVGEKDREILAEDEEKWNMKVVPDSEDASDGQDSSSYELTPTEKQIQGIHTYQIEGYNNFAGDNEWVTSGQANNKFDKAGVMYTYLDSGSAAELYERTSQNNYQQETDNGTIQTLRYWEDGFEWESTNPGGGIMRLTFRLDE